MADFRGQNRMRKNQLVTENQKKDLLNFIAGAGENYQGYAAFCDRHEIPKFTPYYFKTWIQRRRAKLQELRKGHIAAVAAEARMDRKNRLILYEDDIARIEKILKEQNDDHEELTVDQLVKLQEQKRKILESIAKERGEYGRFEDGDDNRNSKPTDLLAALGAEFRQLKAAEDAATAGRSEAVEGEYTEIEETDGKE